MNMDSNNLAVYADESHLTLHQSVCSIGHPKHGGKRLATLKETHMEFHGAAYFMRTLMHGECEVEKDKPSAS